MGLNRRKLKEWVGRKLVSLPMAKRFTLWHEAKHARHLVSHLSSDGLDPEDVASDVEQQVADEVADHIEAWPGRQQYVVRAYDGDDEEIAEYPFGLSGNQAVSAADALALPTPEMEVTYQAEFVPSGGGSLPSSRLEAQQMRHNEVLIRALVEDRTIRQERDAQLIAAQQRALDKHEQRRFEMVELLEEMYCRRQERTLAQRKHEADIQRKDQLVNSLTTKVLPVVASKVGLMLSGVGPSSAEPTSPGAGQAVAGSSAEESQETPTDEDDLMSLAHIFMTLPVEKQAELMEALSADNQAKLLDIIQRVGARVSQEDAA